MDSMATYYHVEQLEGPLEFTGSRVMTMTDYIGMNVLQIANAFYESGLVDYSLPSMFVPQLYRISPNDPLFAYQYNLKNTGQTGGRPGIDVGVEKAWEITNGNTNVAIVVIDAGCIFDHEDLNFDRIMWNDGHDYFGADARNPQEDSDPSPGLYIAHGVACQGIINATSNNSIGVAGIAPECKLLPLKIWDDSGRNNGNITIPERAISRAIHLSRDRKDLPMIISCSWGWDPYTDLPNIRRIIDTAAMFGVPLVFATGNYGERYRWGESIGFPAFLDSVITVGAVRSNGIKWNYSGTGNSLDVVAPSGYWYGADAGDIYTIDQMGEFGYNPSLVTCAFTNENYLCTFGGTSAAAPQVAGILGLIRSRRPDIKSFSDLRNIIDSSAVDRIGDASDSVAWRDQDYGYGLVNATRALLSVCRGDANNNGQVDVLDINYLIDYLYHSGPAPIPHLLMGDADCHNGVNVLDIAFLINYKYKNGAAPRICFDYSHY